MRNLIRRFVIWWHMTGSHHWEKVGRAALRVAQELGEEYVPEPPKLKRTLPGKPPEPMPPPFSGDCYLYEDDHLSLDVRISVNLVMFAAQANVKIKAFIDDEWREVFSCYSQGHSRYNYGEWVGDLFDIARELDSKERRAEKAKHQPLERGGFVEPSSDVFIDESPCKHNEVEEAYTVGIDYAKRASSE